MNVHVRNAAIALALALLVWFGLHSFALAAILGGFVFYILWNLSGNRRIVKASPELREQALSLTPPPGEALIYLIRQGFVGKAAGMNVSIDGRVRAHLKSPQFTCVAVTPGPHDLSAAFGGGAGAQNRAQSQQVTLEPGQALGIVLVVEMGMLKNSIAFEMLRGHELQAIVRKTAMAAPIEA